MGEVFERAVVGEDGGGVTNFFFGWALGGDAQGGLVGGQAA